jgi:hypothetical protein
MPLLTAPKTRARRAAPSRGVRALRVGVLLTAFMAVGGTAWASWAATGLGSGSATTATLAAPSGVSASTSTGATSVTVTWSAPSTGVTPTGYRVDRTNTSTGSTAPACGSSGSSLLTTTSCTDASVPDGTYRYTVVATRSGWTATSATSSAVTVQAAVPTSTSLTSSANPSVVGQSVTLTATVSAGSGTPTGSVVFRDGGSAITCTGGSQTLGSGTATCSTSWTSAGSRSITATYAGSAPYAASSSSSVGQVVGAAPTTTTLVSSTTPSVVGQPVTYTASVSAAAPGGGVPTGTVTFKDGATTVTCAGGSQTLSSGTATCVVAHSSAGTRSISAVYGGSSNHQASTSTVVSQVVNAASTTTSLTTSVTPVVTGQSVTFTATVGAVGPGGGVPTGTVTFKDGSTALSCASGTQTLNGSGVATCTTAFAVTGPRTITATYAANPSYLSSTSAPLTQAVVNASATGLAFSGVTVDGNAVTPVCTGSAGSGYTCTVQGGNNGVISALVGFVDSTGTPIAYSSSTETISWTSTGKTAGTGTVTVAPNATGSTVRVSATKTGTNPASVTVTFTSAGGTTWTSTLTVS